jgi:outer membrane protein TolC
MKNLWVIAALAGLMGIFNPLAAQSILETYLSEAYENNLALRRENFNIQKNMAALAEARGLYYPNVSFNATYTLAAGGRRIQFPVGDLLNPVYSTLNQLTNSSAFPTIRNVNEQFLPNNFHETYFRVIQPVFNSDIYAGYKAKKEQISVQEAKRDAYKKELTKEVKTAYLQYLQTLQLLQVYDESGKLLQELLKFNQKLLSNDKITNEVIFGNEYEISNLQSERAIAEKNNAVAKAYFNFLLNRDLESAILIDSTVINQVMLLDSLNTLQAQAMNNRDELRQLQSGLNALEYQLELNENSKLPKINFIGNVGYQGFQYKFNNEQAYVLAQLALSWDLFKGKQNKHKIEQTKIDIDILQTQYQELESQINLQVKKGYEEMHALEQSLEAAQSAAKSAERNFYLTRKKYEQGQARFLEVIETNTKLTNSKFVLLLKKYDLLIKKAELDRYIGEL